MAQLTSRRSFLELSGLLSLSILTPAWFTACKRTGQFKLESHTGDASGVFDNVHAISGEREMILVDAHVIKPDAKTVVDRIKQSGKVLKQVFITHPHPDHYAGLEVIAEQFPNASIIATPSVVSDITATGPFALKAVQDKYGDKAASKLVIPSNYNSLALNLEGSEIKIIEFQGGEAAHQAALYLAEEKAFIAGDLVYDKVHPLLAEKQLDQYIANLDKIRSVGDIQDIYVGHGQNARGVSILEEMKTYIRFFEDTVAGSKTAQEAIGKITQRYPDYKSADYLLVRSVAAYFPPVRP